MTETDGRRVEVVDPAAAALIRRRYSPCADIRNQITSYLHALVEEGRAVRCAVHLQDHGSVRVGPDRDEVDDAAEAVESDLAVRTPSSMNGIGGAVPIEYGDERLGSLDWTAEERVDAPGPDGRLLRDLAWCFAWQVNRRRLGARTSARLGNELTLIGVSDVIQRLESYIERAASVDLPTLIRGEFGTEKVQVACAVHFGGRRREGPFIELRCATLRAGDEATLHDRFTRARGGSLFLNGIDELQLESQIRLLQLLESRVGQWTEGSSSAAPTVRLIASTTRDLRERVEAGAFSESLFAELSFLPIEVPPLRRRRDDLRHLVQYALARHNGSAGELDAGVLEAFEVYDWPQNLFEMERVLTRLVVMSSSREIHFDDLENLAPRLVADGASRVSIGGTGVDIRVEPTPTTPRTPAEGEGGLPIEEVARRVLSGDLEDLDDWHVGVLRALRCIGDRYQDVMTLGELAEAAYVSPSHLCYLFRSTLGVTFKGLLGLVRIERAKQLLVEETKRRITDVSLDVGFGDLSHFEKTFKRIVKVSPREYRRRRLQELRRHGPLPVARPTNSR